MVEPDNYFLVLGANRECMVTRFQVLPSLLQSGVAGFGHETGADVPPSFGAKTARRWSLVPPTEVQR